MHSFSLVKSDGVEHLVSGQLVAKAALHPTSLSADRQAGTEEAVRALFILSKFVSEVRGGLRDGVLAKMVEHIVPVYV